ncbi:MAG TPA: Stp1/IreP family PP2C-type Ser/Thr phosphatase [Actinomycetota bacterium]
MRVRVGATTDVGVVREQNEDAYLLRAPIYAVADGMGGHQGGEVASRLALETLDRRSREDHEVDLRAAVRDANRVVLDRASGDTELAGMGTTLTLLRIEGPRVRLAHVGDSRAYLLRDGDLRQLTDDHTLVNKMVKEGKLTTSEAKIHPHRSILTRALGVDGDVEVDVFTVDVDLGDRILLCSDGLTSIVSDEVIRGVLASQADPQAACDELVAMANRGGGPDNITVVVLDFEEGEEEALPARAAAETPPPAPPPEGPRRRPSLRGLLLWVLLPLVILIGGFLLARAYVNSQWFVGVHEGSVALYRGIPAEVLGFELFTLVERTDLPAAEAAALQPYRELREGITADSEEDARDVIEQIEEDLEPPIP